MKKKVAVLLAAMVLTPVLALAQAGGIELKSRAEVEVVKKTENGAQVTNKIDADKANVVPGDTVIYTISYLYSGDKPATGVAITNPVPEHMAYMDRTAEGTGTRIDYSIDNGKSYKPADQLMVPTSNGAERPATGADITNIRWTLQKALVKGEKGEVSFRAKVK